MTTVGVPTEIKQGEHRVVLDPQGVALAASSGAEVRVQAEAGVAAGFPNQAYQAAGATIVTTPEEVWDSDIVVKVKEPLPVEYRFFRPDLTVFAYLHLAAVPDLANALVQSGAKAVAFETITENEGLPLLAPMSEIAGRAAAIVAAHQLAHTSGILIGGAAGVPPAEVVVIGLGVAGSMAARGARGLDAHVTGVDVDLDLLRGARLSGLVDATAISNPAMVSDLVVHADVVVGAALVPGDRAPVVVRTEHVNKMRPGSLIVDLAIDQGGCVETSRPTSLSSPTFEVGGVVHYCVTNVPGQYPRTASRALSVAVAPRLCRLSQDPSRTALPHGLNVAGGKVVHPVVARALGMGAAA